MLLWEEDLLRLPQSFSDPPWLGLDADADVVVQPFFVLEAFVRDEFDVTVDKYAVSAVLVVALRCGVGAPECGGRASG